MIQSFKDKRTQEFASGKRIKDFQGFAEQAEPRLAFLHAATTLEDLRSMRPNRLEALSGDRQGQFSIRINDQWRICFKFAKGDAFDVEIIDYH